MVPNCLAPRCMSSASSTPLLSAFHLAHGDVAVTRAAWIDTPGGAMAHHSASGTASLPTMKMPIRARHPQLSFCVTRYAFPSAGLDVCRPDHLAPFRGLVGEECAELGGRHRHRHAAHLDDARGELRVGQCDA